MTGKINIFNYEVFYLDYLEGNLNPRDTEELWAFLNANPQCMLEDEELFSFAESGETTKTYSNKSDLKMVDESLPIDAENAAHFFIAEQEGLLTAEKRTELDAFVQKEGLQQQRAGYEKVYFTPDLSIHFADKAALKQKTVVLAWYLYPSAIAAILILAFFLFRPEPVKIGEGAIPMSEDESTKKDNATKNGSSKDDGVKDYQVNDWKENSRYAYEDESHETTNPARRVGSKEGQGTDKLELNRASILGSRFSQDSIRPLTPSLIAVDDKQEVLYAQASREEMYNPIEPITRAISEKTKTPIDFRKTRPSSARKGFQLKIGKFELSRTGK
jgi:hypothetical protein